MDKLRAHLPERRNILAVYATAVFFVYGWTVLASFWKIPSWLYFLRLGDILSVYAYSFVIDFAESLLLLSVTLFFGFLLPRRWRDSQFSAQGALWILVFMTSMMYRLYTNRSPDRWETFVAAQWTWWGSTLLIALLLSALVAVFRPARQLLESLADRLVIFLYVYLPLTAVAIVVVIARIMI